MNLLDFIDRVLIIDNKKEEIEPLIKLLENSDIDVRAFGPDDEIKIMKNRQLIFVDLMLDEDLNNAKNNISHLVKILCSFITPSFGPYGIIVWTKHSKLVDTLRKYLNTASLIKENASDSEDDLVAESAPRLEIQPMFIVSLDKLKYIEKGNYDDVIDDIEETLTKSNIGYFFMKWCTSVKKAMNKSIYDVYSVCKDFTKQEEQINFILYLLAKNHTGAPGMYDCNTVDCYKAFDELLYADLYTQQNNETIPDFQHTEQSDPWSEDNNGKQKVFAQLNSKMFLDFEAISQQVIVPGNIYKLKGTILDNAVKDKLKEEFQDLTFIDIAIELTPPCDFSNKKVRSRVVHGYVFSIPEDASNSKKNKIFQHLKGDFNYCVNNVLIENDKYNIVFDFRYLFSPDDELLKDRAFYEVWFRTKPKLFADILQKFSSHASRLGLSNIK